jgi:hypothetical protein
MRDIPATPLRSERNNAAAVRVVVRIRPLNLDCEQNCQPAVYPEEISSDNEENYGNDIPPTSPSSSSISSCTIQSNNTISTSSSARSKNSLRVGKAVFSKFQRLRKHHKKKLPQSSTADTSTSESGVPLQPRSNAKVKNTMKKSIPAICYADSNDGSKRRFEFDGVFDGNATQSEIYDGVVGDAVTSNIFQGYNTTILAYGMTGSGKTYTMGGGSDNDNEGVIARAINDVFKVKNSKESDSDRMRRVEINVTMSCLEIYNDELRDLLVLDDNCESTASYLKMRDHGETISIAGLSVVPVDTVEQVKSLLNRAMVRRTTSATNLNERSSRSHAIYTLSISTKQEDGGASTSAKLTLVDLAGSERIKDSGVVGTQQKESININKDLFVLGKVVSSLADQSKKQGAAAKAHHVPYRDSKLTRILRDALGGNCRTILIACVSPADIHVEESINTLRYAERTRSITNCAKQNLIDVGSDTPAQCAALRAENKVLRARIANLTSRLGCETVGFPAMKISLMSLNDMQKSKREVGEVFSGIEAKLAKAQEEAQVARESCRNVSSAALRLKKRFETNEAFTHRSEKPRNSGKERGEPEIHALVNDTIGMRKELLNLLRQLEYRRSTLQNTEEMLQQKTFNFHENFEQAENVRNSQRQQVISLQQKLHLLARELSESEGRLQTMLLKLCENVSGDWIASDIHDRQHVFDKSDSKDFDFEARCEMLSQDVEFLSSENDILRGQNKSLQDEILRLRSMLEQNVPPDVLMSQQKAERADTKDQKTPQSTEHKKIRSHAEMLLEWADRAIVKGRNSTACSSDSSQTSTLGTELRPSPLKLTGAARIERFRAVVDSGPIPYGEKPENDQLLICDIDTMNDDCPCQTSVLSCDPQHVDFYLPKLGVMCSCGRRQETVVLKGDPCHLVNILRQWQVQFLASVGIETASDLINAFQKQSKGLAKSMRKWRKDHNMLSVKIQSCMVALRIWSRTCVAVIKAVEENGNGARPDFLDISLISDSRTVSTLGFTGSGSVASSKH